MTQSSGEALCSTRTILWSLNFGNRDTGTIVEIGSSVIQKQYTGSDRSSRVAHLNRIYRWMQERSVPNVDRMISCRNDDSVSIVYLGPRGVNAPPSSPTDVREAVVCVLEALVACLFISVSYCILITHITGPTFRPPSDISQRHTLA